MWAPRGKKCHEKKNNKKTTQESCHNRRPPTLLSSSFKNLDAFVVRAFPWSAYDCPDEGCRKCWLCKAAYLPCSNGLYHFRSRPLTTVVVWLHDHGARPCWWLPIDSIQVQNDDMQKQHCPRRHGHPMCTCKATAGSAKVERSSQQASVGQGLLLARKGNGRRMAWLVLLLTALIVLFCK